jgi:hypothetical protein
MTTPDSQLLQAYLRRSVTSTRNPPGSHSSTSLCTVPMSFFFATTFHAAQLLRRGLTDQMCARQVSGQMTAAQLAHWSTAHPLDRGLLGRVRNHRKVVLGIRFCKEQGGLDSTQCELELSRRQALALA